MGGMGGGMMGGMGGGMMGGMGGGMMGGMGGGMGGMGMGGMGMGGGGMGMGGGGLGMGGGGMGQQGMGLGTTAMSMPSMPGMGGMMRGMIANSLRGLIEQSIQPESWFDLSDYGEGTILIYPTTAPKKLAIYQTPDVHARIDDLLNQLRKSLGHQVSIEARFLVVSENFLDSVGLDVDFSYDLGGKWGLLTVTQDSITGAAPAESTKVPGSLGGLSPAGTAVGGYGSILDDLQVSFLLEATQARTDSKALAAPKVTVLSGESAIFTLTNEVSYALPPTLTATTATSVGAGTTASGVQNNIGIELVGSGMSVTPTIMKDKKHVLLSIQATQIDLLGFAQHTIETLTPAASTGQATGPAAQTTAEYDVSVPEREVSQVLTRVGVPDNGTLLLGGHKITQDVDKEVGVPVLSKIPIIGRAFSNRSRIRDHKVLLILVRPTILLQDELEAEALASIEGDSLVGIGY
jgi:type II secretory pathway component GspD/PulD (secretin)